MAKSDDKNLQMKSRYLVLSLFHEGSTRKIGYLTGVPYPPSALISYLHVIRDTLNQSIRREIRKLREGQIEVWLLKRSPELGFGQDQRDLLEIVDTKSGKITTYELRDERIHPNMTPEAYKEDNFVTTGEYFGCNGFKRLRLVEGALVEKEEID